VPNSSANAHMCYPARANRRYLSGNRAFLGQRKGARHEQYPHSGARRVDASSPFAIGKVSAAAHAICFALLRIAGAILQLRHSEAVTRTPGANRRKLQPPRRGSRRYTPGWRPVSRQPRPTGSRLVRSRRRHRRCEPPPRGYRRSSDRPSGLCVPKTSSELMP
jgi:hypothetical protein